MSRVHRVLTPLASLRLTPFALLALFAAVMAGYLDAGTPTTWVALPLVVLAVNLAAALLVDARLRLRAPLLVFHVALLAVLALATAGELLRYSGRAQVVTGSTLAADEVVEVAAGPLFSPSWLQSVQLLQRGFEVDFQPGLAPGQTRSRVQAADGGVVVVGNTQPYVEDGFRFHTTSNKGFAALLAWQPDGGGWQPGAVLFPSWPLEDWKQLAAFHPPGGPPLGLELEVPMRAPSLRSWTLDSETATAGVRLHVDDGRRVVTLAPGESLALAGGRLHFAEPRMWMGYTVSHDPLLPWLLASGIVGAAALGLHFWQRFGAAGRPVVASHGASGAGAGV